MSFFEAIDGTFYPISKIINYRKLGDGKSIRVKIGMDEWVDVDESLGAIENAGAAVVKSEPGTYYIGLLGNGSEGVWFEPVIAWMVMLTGAVKPITANGLEAGSINEYAIASPDGSVSRTEDREYDSFVEFLDSIDPVDEYREQALKRAVALGIGLK